MFWERLKYNDFLADKQGVRFIAGVRVSNFETI